jgi:hypothetical protein
MAQIAKLEEFVSWFKKHITGDEKGEAQIFLDRLFQAFGQPGLLEVGGKPEFRIKKSSEDGQGTSFADYVWKPIVLIEMKKRGEDLKRHYQQAFSYWVRLCPNRPQFVVLCNFDSFFIYDFTKQVDDPVDIVLLSDLPKHYIALNFLSPGSPAPRFNFDRESVTREAADILADIYRRIINKKRSRVIDPVHAQRFILQTLVCLFSEDIGLLPKHFFTGIIEDSSPEETFDALGSLFRALNNKSGNLGGKYKDVAYFNGGLFAKSAEIELEYIELAQLRKATKYDWSKVSPEIFGTLFQDSLDKDQRHALGAHFTSAFDIMKIITPTISRPWNEALARTESKNDLKALLKRLKTFTVLDPACGSGNFLYTAFRELKRIENLISLKLFNLYPEEKPKENEKIPSFVMSSNFFGIDILPFAVELAKITMMLGKKLAIDEFHYNQDALPLDNLDKNFIASDALLDSNGNIVHWPKTDVIIGNPPYLGAKRLKVERGSAYVELLRKKYKDIPGMADYCVYWFKKANDNLPLCSKENIFSGRAGLVGTQNIRSNKSREAGLDNISNTGTIVDAVETQKWSGDAKVHVSIVNWIKSKDPKVLPTKRFLWHKINQKDGDGDSGMSLLECDFISSSLSEEVSLKGVHELSCNLEPKVSFNGQMIGHAKFQLSSQERTHLINTDPSSKAVIFKYLNGSDLLTQETTDSYVIDFGTLSKEEASHYKGAFNWVKTHVLPDRERKADESKNSKGKQRPHHKGFLKRWWQLSFPMPELISLISKQNRYLAISLVTQRPIFAFVSKEVRPSNLLQVFCLEDDYSFGILSSIVHWEWFKERSSKLGTTYRFGESIWNTFPWPQKVSEEDVLKISEISKKIQELRSTYLKRNNGGLRRLYQSLETPGKSDLKDLHTELDSLVIDLYKIKSEDRILETIISLNEKVYQDLSKGNSCIAPGCPYKDLKAIISPYAFA